MISRHCFRLCVLTLICPAWAMAEEAKPPLPAKLPLTGLAPAKLVPDLCLTTYRVSTTSPECQAFFDQGLGFFYSYAWMEAARSFETAAGYDPDCAMAWWGLSRAIERWGRGKHLPALEKAQQLLSQASDREQMLITSRLQLKEVIPPTANQTAKQLAAKTLDELLILYHDDEEAWFNRAQLAETREAAVPYYLALLRINPLHAGANHELVHFYERHKRPALGWIYAENYIRSSPGLPHAFHMQAHLAMRLGRWDKTTDRSAKAIELQQAYHKFMNVQPKEDWQYSHHLETLTISLVHDGRFQEARAIKAESWRCGYRHWLPWFQLHLAERDYDEAAKIVEEHRNRDKITAAYLSALLSLHKEDVDRAKAEVEVLQQAFQKNKKDARLELRLLHAQGVLMCHMGDADAGLKLLARTVERTINDYAQHAWGHGAYYMEAWGLAALRAGNVGIAEEAFQEALAHDPGSVRGALGMQVLCERLGRVEEAERYARRAQRCWAKADPGMLEKELAALRDSCGVAAVD
ncbi:MAG: tetratricopeptide repeat protein [Gemmataceae bacterium]